MNKWLALALTLLLAGWLGFSAAQPPAPKPVTAAADQFAAARAMADIRIIAREPHPTGSVGNDVVRAHVIERLRSLGFSVRQTVTPLPEKPRERLRKWGGANADMASAVTLIALRPGHDPAAQAVAVMAHYDSVWASPGAADDGMGVASALEIARAIPQASQARDLVLLITDAEELGLVGAKAFFAPGTAGDPLADRIGALVDLESRGGGGRAVMFETGPANGNMIKLLAASVANPAANSLAVKIYELLPNSTDFTPAKQRGVAGFNFAFMGRAELYHSPLSTPDAIDPGSLQHMGDEGLAITRALVTATALPAPAPDAVFSDVLGWGIIAYPVWAGWVLVAGIAALIIGAARRQVAEWRWPQVAASSVDALVGVLACGVLLYAGNLLSGADGKVNYYDRLAALPRLETQALLLFAAGLIITLALVPARRPAWVTWAGLALVNLLMVIMVQALLPAAAPILAWPLLLAALAMALAARWRGLALLAPALAAIFGFAFAGGFGHFTLLAIGPGMPSAIAIFAPLTLLLLWPLTPRLPRRPALLVALALVLVAGGLALWVRLDPIAASVPPYSDKS